MKIKHIIGGLCLLLFVGLYSCSPKQQISTYYSYETACLRTEGDGSHQLKAWGKGSNKGEALIQAQKNALKDILFKGINQGKSTCQVKPLLVTVNAEEKHQAYFFSFFAKDGKYAQFITDVNDKKATAFVADSRTVCGVEVRVLRSELRKQLVKDKILEQ